MATMGFGFGQALDGHGALLAQAAGMARRATPAGGSKGSEPAVRSSRARQVGDLLPDVGGRAFRKFGFAQASLVTHWREIVGDIYARHCVPEHLKFAQGKGSGGTLTIRVEGPFAGQLQHLEPQIIARANQMLGAGMVERVRLVQGFVGQSAAEEPTVEPTAPAEPSANLRTIADPELRSALERLSAALGGRKGPPRVR